MPGGWSKPPETVCVKAREGSINFWRILLVSQGTFWCTKHIWYVWICALSGTRALTLSRCFFSLGFPSSLLQRIKTWRSKVLLVMLPLVSLLVLSWQGKHPHHLARVCSETGLRLSAETLSQSHKASRKARERNMSMFQWLRNRNNAWHRSCLSIFWRLGGD